MPFDLGEPFIIAAESRLGARLPAAYRSAMLRSNGGELVVEDDDWMLYPIADTSDRKRLSRSANHIIKETQACRQWRAFPDDALAIATNGAGDQLVFLKRGAEFEATVYLWSHESGSLERVADDFSELDRRT